MTAQPSNKRSSGRRKPTAKTKVPPSGQPSSRSGTSAKQSGVSARKKTTQTAATSSSSPSPKAVWPDGRPADVSDTTIKAAVQRTGQDAVVFTKIGDANTYVSELVRQLKLEGWNVHGSSASGRRCYRDGDDAFAIVVTTRVPRKKASPKPPELPGERWV